MLSGTGAAAPTDNLNPASLRFHHGHWSIVQRANRHAYQLRRPYAYRNQCFGDGCVPDFECLRQPVGGRVLRHKPCLRSNTSGQPFGHPHDYRRTANPDGCAFRRRRRAGSPKCEPNQFEFSQSAAGSGQRATDRNREQYRGAALANIGFQLSGEAAASYSITGTNCGLSLGSGSSCTAQIVFPPTSREPLQRYRGFTSTLGVSAVSVSLNGGSAITGGLSSNPSYVAFPVIGVGQSSSAVQVVISNSSGFSIGSLVLAVNLPFLVSQSTCSSSPGFGASCIATLLFDPTVSGAATGALTITSPDLSSPFNVALSGTGFDFATAISGSSSLTVSAGQTANFGLTINPANGVAGTFAFACGTLPTFAKCTFNRGQ